MVVPPSNHEHKVNNRSKRKGLRLPWECNRISLIGKEQVMNGDSESQNKKNLSFKRLPVVVIAIPIILLLLAVALPSFIKARNTSCQNACINNLRMIDAGREEAALEHGWNSRTNGISLRDYLDIIPPATHGDGDALSKDEEEMLRTWFRSRTYDRGDYVQKATDVGAVCMKHALSRDSIVRLIGPATHVGPSVIAYSFAPSQRLEFEFDESGRTRTATVTGRSINPDGSLD